MKLVLASHNAGKIREFNARLQAHQIELVSIAQFSEHAPEETGLSFVENAMIKARHACEVSGLSALADDSGLVVPALNGEPGIYSSRYAGKNATAADNRQRLLRELADVQDRHAYFYCSLVLLKHAKDPTPIISHGRWDGEIALSEKGEGGFGYDALFFLDDYQHTAAQLDPLIKNNISHRGQAIDRLLLEIGR